MKKKKTENESDEDNAITAKMQLQSHYLGLASNSITMLTGVLGIPLTLAALYDLSQRTNMLEKVMAQAGNMANIIK